MSEHSDEEAPTTPKSNTEMLMNSDERLRLLEDNVRDFAIIELASDGRIAHWNLGAERILGYQEEEIVGQNIAVIFTPEDRAAGKDVQELQGAIAAGRALDECWHIKKDGTRFWASGIMTGLRAEDGSLKGFAKILRDLTERRLAAELLAAAQVRLQRTAEVLQRSILMGSLTPSLAGLEVSTQYEAASDDLLVGGDFFDAFALAEGKSALVVGDVMGKGLAAAALTAQVKFALRVFLREEADPVRALFRLNNFLCHSERLDHASGSAQFVPAQFVPAQFVPAQFVSAQFVVACVGVFDPVAGDLQLCGAGTEPPLVLRGDGTQEEVETGGHPLGVFEGTDYAAVTLHLEPGDTLLLTTDGITEARRGDLFLGYAGMARLAAQAMPLGSLEASGQAIVEEARAFSGGVFRDDVCLLLARRT